LLQYRQKHWRIVIIIIMAIVIFMQRVLAVVAVIAPSTPIVVVVITDLSDHMPARLAKWKDVQLSMLMAATITFRNVQVLVTGIIVGTGRFARNDLM